MREEETAIGMRVRYPRTGTTGLITRIESERGILFAELDSTHLLYRIDLLVPAFAAEKASRVTTGEDAQAVIEREREFVSGTGFSDAIKNIDQSCEGGG